jgi:hypothetical protein
MVGTIPRNTSPVPPSIVIKSPFFSVISLTDIFSFLALIFKTLQPATQAFPMPLATTAAWLVIPPLLVRTPWASTIPWMSSGVVSVLTNITFSPSFPNSSASSAVKTTFP